MCRLCIDPGHHSGFFMIIYGNQVHGTGPYIVSLFVQIIQPRKPIRLLIENNCRYLSFNTGMCHKVPQLSRFSIPLYYDHPAITLKPHCDQCPGIVNGELARE